MTKIINISLSSDNNYAPFLCTTIYSLLENSNKNNLYYIYILDGGISEINKNKILKSLSKFENKIIKFIKINKTTFDRTVQFMYITQAAYYRLVLPELLPKTKKVLYLDCDLLILKDVATLYNNNLGKRLIGSCKIFHPNYKSVLQKIYPKSKLINVFNSGVLLMNLEEMRKTNSSKKLIKFMNKNSKKLTGDQDVFNVVLNKKNKLIDPIWNSSSYIFIARNTEKCNLTEKKFKQCKDNPSIIHFDGGKPWQSGYSHPYKNHFIKILRKTEFYNYKIKFNLKHFITNKTLHWGTKVANLLPNKIYNLIEKKYLENNFLEKKYKINTHSTIHKTKQQKWYHQ